MSLGGSRFEWLFPFDFKRIIWRFKLQYLSILVLIYLFIKFSFEKKGEKFSDYLIIFSVIIFCLLTIMHQLMTLLMAQPLQDLLETRELILERYIIRRHTPCGDFMGIMVD